MRTKQANNITEHWNKIESHVRQMIPGAPDAGFQAAQRLFHSGYFAALGDIAVAEVRACDNEEVYETLMMQLVLECERFARAKGLVGRSTAEQ